MAISLYDVSVTSFLQTLGGVAGFLDKGLTHCKATGIDLNELVETRLQPDMLPFRFQVIAVAHHSLGAWILAEQTNEASLAPLRCVVKPRWRR